MATSVPCSCGIGPALCFACSGASDVGAITDRAARALARDQVAFMCCTAAIGAEIDDIMEKARNAGAIIILDGCDYRCALKVLETKGFRPACAVCLEDLGMQKGKTGVTPERVDQVVQYVKKEISRPQEVSSA